MPFNPVTDNQLNNELAVVEAKKSQYIQAVASRDAAQATLTTAQAVVDTKASELNAAVTQLESSVATQHVS